MLDSLGHGVHDHPAAKIGFFQQSLLDMLVLHDGEDLHHDRRQDHNAHTGQPAIL